MIPPTPDPITRPCPPTPPGEDGGLLQSPRGHGRRETSASKNFRANICDYESLKCEEASPENVDIINFRQVTKKISEIEVTDPVSINEDNLLVLFALPF